MRYGGDADIAKLVQNVIDFCHVVLLCRPMWVEYPKDRNTFGMDDQYLVGESAAWVEMFIIF